jgi:hypothetical protein
MHTLYSKDVEVDNFSFSFRENLYSWRKFDLVAGTISIDVPRHRTLLLHFGCVRASDGSKMLGATPVSYPSIGNVTYMAGL